jgi:hypothetical protein
MDISGKEILRMKINEKAIINTSQLAKGVYFINIIGQESVKPIKLIKD